MVCIKLFVFPFMLSLTGAFGGLHFRHAVKYSLVRQANTMQDLVTFTLYTKQNPKGVQLFMSDEAIDNSKIAFNKTTKFITNGYVESKINVSYVDIKDAYISKYDYNIILVDWTALSGPMNDSQALTNSGPVSQYYGNFVNFLITKGGKANLFHLIGHGLGAHISGQVGAQVISNYNTKIARLTALDASLQYVRKLQESDASLVDVIHTSGDVYGIYDAIGKIDFYPNKGNVPQPGCGGFFKEIIACSHFKSVTFYKNSICDPLKYVATKCTSYQLYKEGQCLNEPTSYMGENVTVTASGAYFLSTY